MTDTEDPPRPGAADLAEAVLAYLARHPEAADTVEGIARWWLNLPPSAWPRLAVALDRLVMVGRLERRVLRGGGRVYFRPDGSR